MSNPPKKNFRIEPFKHPVVMDDNYADRTWKILEDAINHIYTHNNTTGLSIEQLYRHAYNMVLHKFGENLYSGLVSTLTSRLESISRSIYAAQGGLMFLNELNQEWERHKEALHKIRDIFVYMDMIFVPATHKTPVFDLGVNLWREIIVNSNVSIQTRLCCTLLDLVHKERLGEDIDRVLMRNVLKMLMDLGGSVYKKNFERPFLDASVEFYRGESQKLIECWNCGDYCRKVESCLNDEIGRVCHYLNERTASKVIDVVNKEMIENHMLRLVHLEKNGLVEMLLDDKYEDLGRLYDLSRRVANGPLTICDVMTSHLRRTGKEFVTDQEKLKDPIEYVQCLMDEKDKYEKIISLAFNNDKSFQDALDSSFKYFVNLNPLSPEFISLFVDDKLRKGLKGVSEEDMELILDKVIKLFRNLHERDVFEKCYRQHLAKRLLSGKTVSDDAEKSFIEKLKTECGNQFTSKLEGMLNDMKISEDMMQEYNANHGADLGEGATLAVQVLTTCSWPTQNSITCKLPAEVSPLCEKFKVYYLGMHKGRKLSWQTNMGTANIKATFGNGEKHELNVSTYQMCVLMLFNNADRLTYKEIEQATEIPAPDLKRCLQSLACVKGKNVLHKEPMSKDIGEDDTFFVNDNFTSKLYKVKIGTIVAQKESELERQETMEAVTENRKMQIDAAVARIMKSRRVLYHKNLISEVTKHLESRFLANPVEIKKRIEALIDKEYLERDKNDRQLYLYLA